MIAPNQIRTVLETYRDTLATDLFPGRAEVPKTVIFAKDDHHAEEIVHIAREVFAKGNDFAKKITYRVTGVGPEELIAAFRNQYNPRIAVTVDMIATGTDIKPVEVLIFLRDVKSALYFEQMKGRGVRTINPADLTNVTPDAYSKDRFVLIDAVGVTESAKTIAQPLEREPTVAFDKLLEHVVSGRNDADLVHFGWATRRPRPQAERRGSRPHRRGRRRARVEGERRRSPGQPRQRPRGRGSRG